MSSITINLPAYLGYVLGDTLAHEAGLLIGLIVIINVRRCIAAARIYIERR